jgi:hypothetical protein
MVRGIVVLSGVRARGKPGFEFTKENFPCVELLLPPPSVMSRCC